MGILTDVIIANPDEANAINAAGGGHARQWECLESKRVDTIRFWTLQQIVAGEPLSDVNAAGSFMSGDLITQRSDDGPWVFQIPVGLQSAIAALPQTAEASVAKAWAATEERRNRDRSDYPAFSGERRKRPLLPYRFIVPSKQLSGLALREKSARILVWIAPAAYPERSL
jgi:hypothetical protein